VIGFKDGGESGHHVRTTRLAVSSWSGVDVEEDGKYRDVLGLCSALRTLSDSLAIIMVEFGTRAAQRGGDRCVLRHGEGHCSAIVVEYTCSYLLSLTKTTIKSTYNSSQV
jgi:hypothetical protein